MDKLWEAYIRQSKGWAADPIAQVHPRIFLGSAKDIDLFMINSKHITHIINCAEPEFTNKWYKNEFPDQYACINAQDTTEFDITTRYPIFEAVMNQYLADPTCKNIFIHCQCGINRSAFLLMMYMCIKFHYSMENVVKNILLQRPCCFRNTSFRKQVTDYIKKLD